MFKTSSTTTFLPSNIMLHFPLEKSENLYNGVCNWDMASRVVENKSSFYGYQTKAEVEENIAQRKHVAPKLVYVLGSQDSQNSLEVIKMNHLYSKATDAYSVGILASQIWKEEWNRKLLSNQMGFAGFELKLRGLQDKDPKTRLSILDVLTRFTSRPFKMEMPECYFCKKI
jgi:hypothetical protein